MASVTGIVLGVRVPRAATSLLYLSLLSASGLRLSVHAQLVVITISKDASSSNEQKELIMDGINDFVSII
jgi:hypothetical protein